MLLCLVQSLWKMMKYLRYDILSLFHLTFTGLSEWVSFGRYNNCIILPVFQNKIGGSCPSIVSFTKQV